MKNLIVACGVTNHTHATVTQLIKMGVDPTRIVVADDNREKFGSLSVPLTNLKQDDVILVAFDGLVEKLNQDPSPDPRFIFTRTEVPVYSKALQISRVNHVFELENYYRHCYAQSFRGDAFIRPDRSHGGKASGTLAAIAGQDNEFIITDRCEFPVSIMMQVAKYDDKVQWDLIISPSGFKTYDDIYTITSLERCQVEELGFTPYEPSVQISYADHVLCNDASDVWTDVANKLLEALMVESGTITAELFVNFKDMNDILYLPESVYFIESNQRNGDISLSTSPTSWAWTKHELIAKEVL